MAESFSSQIAAKNLQLVVEPPDASPVIRSDRKRVHQVLTHLLTNAVTFTEQGEIRLACTALDDHVEMCVSDTGIGIPQKKMARLFESFRQRDGTVRGRYEGAGVGLYLCKKLVTLLGGEIWAESVEGQGAQFTFTLPHQPS